MLLLCHRLYVCKVSVFAMKKASYFSNLYVVVYVLVQSEEEFSLTWRAKNGLL